MARRDPPPNQSSIPVDIEEYADEFVVTADLPGLRKQDIDVRVQEDRLRIDADFGERGSGRYLHAERPEETTSRTVRLPERVDPKRTTARFNGGVLTVTLEKVEHTIPVELH